MVLPDKLLQASDDHSMKSFGLETIERAIFCNKLKEHIKDYLETMEIPLEERDIETVGMEYDPS